MAPQTEAETKAQVEIFEPACEGDVLREQLDYLIEHAAENGQCDCSECQRFIRVRAILLEIFAEPSRGNVQEIGSPFAKAA